MNKSIKRKVVNLGLAMLVVTGMSATAFAASRSLNGGGATWSGGENSSNILFSKVVDNKEDGLRYNVTVWVKNDKGDSEYKTGTTNAVGAKGQVKAIIGAGHSNPFVTEKAGYKNFTVVR